MQWYILLLVWSSSHTSVIFFFCILIWVIVFISWSAFQKSDHYCDGNVISTHRLALWLHFHNNPVCISSQGVWMRSQIERPVLFLQVHEQTSVHEALETARALGTRNTKEDTLTSFHGDSCVLNTLMLKSCPLNRLFVRVGVCETQHTFWCKPMGVKQTVRTPTVSWNKVLPHNVLKKSLVT